ncbi:MAG: hypothetical protein EOO52_08185 [Gammaproteobacteria bacterium]|nr:MAG: hypothetical protein EOO52_08185 [Gammaproteobacteria bacterium]
MAWASPDMERLGEYDEEFVYGNDGSTIAKVNEGYVLNIIGEELGNILGNKIFLSGSNVGSFIGSPAAGAASIAFIFNCSGVRGS